MRNDENEIVSPNVSHECPFPAQPFGYVMEKHCQDTNYTITLIIACNGRCIP